MSLVFIYLFSIFALNLLYFTIFNDMPDLSASQRTMAGMAAHFLFFGMILAMLTRIYEEWRFTEKGLALKMIALILVGAGISYAANIWVYEQTPDVAQKLAIAAFGATLTSGLCVFALYHLTQNFSSITHLSIALVPSAIIDSLVFSFLIAGLPDVWIGILEAGVAKAIGAIMWGYLLVHRKVLG